MMSRRMADDRVGDDAGHGNDDDRHACHQSTIAATPTRLLEECLGRLVVCTDHWRYDDVHGRLSIIEMTSARR
jgi:hypothetical protein